MKFSLPGKGSESRLKGNRNGIPDEVFIYQRASFLVHKQIFFRLNAYCLFACTDINLNVIFHELHLDHNDVNMININEILHFIYRVYIAFKLCFSSLYPHFWLIYSSQSNFMSSNNHIPKRKEREPEIKNLVDGPPTCEKLLAFAYILYD